MRTVYLLFVGTVLSLDVSIKRHDVDASKERHTDDKVEERSADDPIGARHNKDKVEERHNKDGGEKLSRGIEPQDGSIQTSESEHDGPDPTEMGCECSWGPRFLCECCHLYHHCKRDRRCTWYGHHINKPSVGTQCYGPIPTVTDEEIAAVKEPFGCPCTWWKMFSNKHRCHCCHKFEDCEPKHIGCYWMPESFSAETGFKSCKDKKIVPADLNHLSIYEKVTRMRDDNNKRESMPTSVHEE